MSVAETVKFSMILLVLSECAGALPGRCKVYNLTCNSSPAHCDMTCHFEAVSLFAYKISFACDIKPVMQKVLLGVKFYQKNHKVNAWKKLPNDAVINFCELVTGTQHPMLKAFIPGFIESLGSVIHPCPYTGLLAVQNASLSAFKVPIFKPSGTQIRVDATFYNNRIVNLFTLQFHMQVIPLDS